MPRDWTDRVQDILDSIAQIRVFIQGKDFEAFNADPRTADAVAYNLLIIGECAAHLPLSLTEKHPEVPWARVRGIRNVLAHAYFDVDPVILWKTATVSLPDLESAMRAIAAEIQKELP